MKPSDWGRSHSGFRHSNLIHSRRFTKQTSKMSILQRKRKYPEADSINMDEQSPWLQRFLSVQKECTIPPPPAVEESSDTYLRQFIKQFTNPVNFLDNDEFTSTSSSSTTNIDSTPDNFSEESAVALEVPAVPNGRIRLSNLPYTINEATIAMTGKKYGFDFIAVVIEIDQRTKLPTGSASVQLAPGLDEKQVGQTLQGEDFGGRPVRAQYEHIKKRRVSAGKADSRYFSFGDAVATKCNICGQLGHTGKHCTELGTAFPCHLCAGRDHEASTSLL